ncbi:metallophosphoesterase [Tetragenococcus solitarius]|uniref:Phosphoesterase n=1 Tax=Tetragenococcus solitarius TaxID=71453 RepID=A0ABP6KJG8_9ENTE|nr:metallophosphoesterase [Tetragenococcus solitarius]
MKYLVVSDSHGDRQILVDLFNHYKGKVDYIFHCGDSELSEDDSLWQGVYVVTGNMDSDPAYQKIQVVDTQEDVVYLTHGHLSGVKMGLTQLDMQAQEHQATIALFGHTHQLGCEVNKGRLFLNPGSILQPRGSVPIKTYAIIESTNESFQVQYYDRNFEPIEDLSFVFNK